MQVELFKTIFAGPALLPISLSNTIKIGNNKFKPSLLFMMLQQQTANAKKITAVNKLCSCTHIDCR